MQFSLAHIQYIPVSSQDVVLPVPPLVPGHAEDLTQVNENESLRLLKPIFDNFLHELGGLPHVFPLAVHLE